MDLSKRVEPIMIDYYLPEHIRGLFRVLGLSSAEIEEKVKEIMSDKEQKRQFLEAIKRANEIEEAGE